jgi:hypothetical protein
MCDFLDAILDAGSERNGSEPIPNSSIQLTPDELGRVDHEKMAVV